MARYDDARNPLRVAPVARGMRRNTAITSTSRASANGARAGRTRERRGCGAAQGGGPGGVGVGRRLGGFGQRPRCWSIARSVCCSTGRPPQRILCLTFTNAAAAEMANRLRARLAGWAVAREAALESEPRDAAGRGAGGPYTRTPRGGCWRGVLDAPGGMPIMTLHAFCQSLLRRFPLEAGAPPWFEVLDEREARETMDDVRRRLNRGAGRSAARRASTSSSATSTKRA